MKSGLMLAQVVCYDSFTFSMFVYTRDSLIISSGYIFYSSHFIDYLLIYLFIAGSDYFVFVDISGSCSSLQVIGQC